MQGAGNLMMNTNQNIPGMRWLHESHVIFSASSLSPTQLPLLTGRPWAPRLARLGWYSAIRKPTHNTKMNS